MTVQIAGFQIEREIGHGGMASVYLATQQSCQRQVALKVISPMLAADPNLTRRFIKEGALAAKLVHPNIIKIFDSGSSDSHYYLAMEYFPHGMLHERIQAGLSLVDALRTIKCIAGALDYAHKQGVVHRDIKSQNILIYQDGMPVVADFGIAKALDESAVLTATGAVIGSPSYMSPEQIEGKPSDTRSDIYALGILFYETLVGHLPYAADNFMAMAYQHVNQPIPQLPSTLAAFQPLLEKTLAKQPEQRFQTAQEFVDALTAIEAPSPLADMTCQVPAVRINHSQEHKLAALTQNRLLGLAMSVVLLVAAGLYYQHWQAQAEQSRIAQHHQQQLIAQTLRYARWDQAAGNFQAGLEKLKQGFIHAPNAPALIALKQKLEQQLAALARKRYHEESLATDAASSLPRKERRQIQTALTLLGFDTQGVDGIFGFNTQQAIMAFQTQRSFLVTGHLTTDQLLALLDEADELITQRKAKQAQKRRRVLAKRQAKAKAKAKAAIEERQHQAMVAAARVAEEQRQRQAAAAAIAAENQRRQQMAAAVEAENQRRRQIAALRHEQMHAGSR